MRALVTGGAGFIGSHVAENLLLKGYEVVILDDLSGGFRENIPNRAKFIEGSITDPLIVDATVKGCDYIFHLAAYAAEGLSHFVKRFNYNNNLIGSINLINSAINYGIKCFVFTSSLAVYGSGQVPFTEEMIPTPEDPYGIAKRAVEQDLEESRRMFGLDYIIFRPHNVYGNRQNIWDPYRNVIGIYFNQIMNGEPITVFGDGTQTRAFSYITDVAPVIAKSIEVPEAYNLIFNLGSDEFCTINKLAEVVSACMHKANNWKIEHLPSRFEVKHAFTSHNRAKKILGAKAKVSLEAGVTLMAEWVKKVGAKKGKTFENIEIKKNLPLIWANRKE
jgi:UDP-glucose 4-epimerase